MSGRDAFAELGIPRRAWIEPEVVHARFRELASTAHPDAATAAGGSCSAGSPDRFAELQWAASTLADPVRRLRHLLELEGATPPASGALAGPLQELGLRAGQVLRPAGAVVARLAAAGSAVGRALELPQVLDARADCEALLAEVNRRLEREEARLKEAGDRIDPAELGEVLGVWVYLQRWQSQARALLLRLEIP